MQEREPLPDWARSLISWALLGQIYPEIRAIQARLKGSHLLLSFYLDREPADEDRENMEEVADMVDAGDGEQRLSKIDLHIERLHGRLNTLDESQHTIYARREV